jgi:hypothetical protein
MSVLFGHRHNTGRVLHNTSDYCTVKKRIHKERQASSLKGGKGENELTPAPLVCVLAAKGRDRCGKLLLRESW